MNLWFPTGFERPEWHLSQVSGLPDYLKKDVGLPEERVATARHNAKERT